MERFVYERENSVWNGAIVELYSTSTIENFRYYRLVDATQKLISIGARVGDLYLLNKRFLEPVYMPYDPSQQEDLDSDI